MNRTFKFIRALTILAVFSAVLYSGSYFYLKTVFQDNLSPSRPIKIERFKLFIDGVVIEKLRTDHLEFERLYLQGYPWQLFQVNPNYIYSNKLHVKSGALFKNKIDWPFKDSVPITIDHVRFETVFLNKIVQFEGRIKKTEDTPLLLNFESITKNIDVTGQSELQTKNYFINAIDVEFQDARLSYNRLNTKRTSGWLSFSHEGQWNVIGEVDAGFLKVSDHPFFDGTLKINGPVQAPDYTFSGKNKLNDVMVFNKIGGNFSITANDKTLPVKGKSFNTATFSHIDRALERHNQYLLAEAQNKKEAELKKSLKVKKAKPVVIEEAKTEIPVPGFVKPVTLPEASFYDLIRGSAFSGFYYNRPLVVTQTQCRNPSKITCWTARGKKGMFTYDPEVLPSYLLRIKNYEQVKQLKDALLNFQVNFITISGQGNSAGEMILKGKTAEGREAEIQLSILDLE